MDVKRFELKTEMKVMKALSKLLNVADNPISEDEAIKDNLEVVDRCMICAIRANTEEAKRVLSRFKEKDSKFKIPELNYEHDGKLAVSSYDNEYLKLIIGLMDTIEEKSKITINKDFPMMLENKHFKVILAPRVEN